MTVSLRSATTDQTINQTARGLYARNRCLRSQKQTRPAARLVEAGEDVIITRRGKAVAKLVAPNASTDREQARAAAVRIRARRRGMTLGGLNLKDLINEGRP